MKNKAKPTHDEPQENGHNDIVDANPHCQTDEQEGCQGQCQEPPSDATTNSTAQKLAEVQDKYVRLVAEFDNYRKRTARERLDLLMTASEDTILGLLPVLDDFERALQATASSNDLDALREGVVLIQQKLLDYLATKGLKQIDSNIKEFDTDMHDAVTRFPVQAEDQKNKIIDTVQKGYKLHDKVIRYAKVVVGE